MECRINQMCHVPLKWPGSTGADGLALLGEAGDSHAGTPGQPDTPLALYTRLYWHAGSTGLQTPLG